MITYTLAAVKRVVQESVLRGSVAHKTTEAFSSGVAFLGSVPQYP